MDHGMGDNSGGNGILMEDEIFDTPPANSQPQAAQPQMGASSQYNTMAQTQSEASSQYAAATQSSDELAAFQSAPSFDAMDGMDTGFSAAGSNDAFGSNDTASSAWQNQNSDMAFQGSYAGGNIADQVVTYKDTTSNMVLGLVGALIGALIGAALWIVIYQLGYLAGIAGAAIIGFSIKGYAILGKNIDIKGLICCVVLSIATIYFSHRVAFTISCMGSMNEFYDTHMNFIMAYTNLNDFMKKLDAASQALGLGESVIVAYWRDLFVGYVLSAVVGIPMARNMMVRS